MKRALVTVAVLALAGLIAMKLLEPVESTRPARDGTSAPVAAAPQAPNGAALARRPARAPRTSATAGSGDRWKEFQRRYGESLSAVFGEGGCLESIRGVGREGAGDAAQRAAQMLKDLGSLICADDHWGFGPPKVLGNSVSAQVSFRQSLDGLLVYPRGTLSFDLGPHGELFSLYASPVKIDRIGNERILSSEQAQSRTLAALDGVRAPVRIEGGGPILWVARPDSNGETVARHAYRYGAAGREVITDAETGAVISVRDLRNN